MVLNFAPNIRLWVYVSTALVFAPITNNGNMLEPPRCTHNPIFGAKIRKLSSFFFQKKFIIFTALIIFVYCTGLFSLCLVSVPVCKMYTPLTPYSLTYTVHIVKLGCIVYTFFLILHNLWVLNRTAYLARWFLCYPKSIF